MRRPIRRKLNARLADMRELRKARQRSANRMLLSHAPAGGPGRARAPDLSLYMYISKVQSPSLSNWKPEAMQRDQQLDSETWK